MEKKYKVFYQGSLYGHFGRDRAGKEIAVNKSFTWGGEEWLVPSVYFCGKGLVADMFKKVSIESFREFIEKFGLDENSDCDGFSDEQQAEIEAENPLNSDIFASIQFGGRKSDMEFSSSDCWNPLFPDSGDAAEALLDRYGLIQRVCPENTRKYKDVLVHRKDYELTELDNTFIEQLVKAKRKTFG